jgi:hypothetical protein
LRTDSPLAARWQALELLELSLALAWFQLAAEWRVWFLPAASYPADFAVQAQPAQQVQWVQRVQRVQRVSGQLYSVREQRWDWA